MAKRSNGVLWTVAGSVTSIATQAGVFLIAALRFSPAEIGTLSIAFVVMALFVAVVPLGNDAYIVHAERLTARMFSNYVSYSLVAALLLTLAASAAALIDRSLDPFLPDGVLFASLGAGLFDSLVVILSAAFQRNRDFRRSEIVNVLRNALFVCGAAGAVALGSLELVVVSRAVASLAGVLLQAFWLSRGRARFAKHAASEPSFSAFARHSLSRNFINFLSRNAEVIVAGPALGIVQLGLYDFSKRLIGQPRDFIGGVVSKFCFPLFSRINSLTEGNRRRTLFERAYLNSVHVTAIVGFPIFSFAVVSGPYLVPLALGAEWSEAVPTFQIFAATALLQILGQGFITSALMAIGRARAVVLIELVLLPVRLVLVFLAGHLGATAVAVVMCMAIVLQLGVAQYLLFRTGLLSSKLLARAIILPFMFSAIGCLASYLLSQLFEEPWLRLIVVVVTFWPIAAAGTAFLWRTRTSSAPGG